MDPIQNDDYSSQLRCLRLLLGKNFKPISTAALAELTEIPHVSIRGVEAGRRELNETDRLAIDIKLGAVWDPESQQWLAVWQEEKGVPLPFSRQTYERYSEGLISSRTLAGPNINRIAEALLRLTHTLQPEEVAQTLLTVHHVILNIAKQKNVPPDIIKSLEELHPELNFMIIKKPGRDKALADLENSPGSEMETTANSADKKKRAAKR